MTREQFKTCSEFNDCSICPYGKQIDLKDNEPHFTCGLDEEE